MVILHGLDWLDHEYGARRVRHVVETAVETLAACPRPRLAVLIDHNAALPDIPAAELRPFIAPTLTQGEITKMP